MTEMMGDSVHLKLDVLWYGAERRGEPVAVRLDRRSMAELLASREASIGSSLQRTANGWRWRGLPFVFEACMPPLTLSEVAITNEVVVSEPRILTIECKDSASGRTVYFNDPGNPPAFR